MIWSSISIPILTRKRVVIRIHLFFPLWSRRNCGSIYKLPSSYHHETIKLLGIQYCFRLKYSSTGHAFQNYHTVYAFFQRLFAYRSLMEIENIISCQWWYKQDPFPRCINSTKWCCRETFDMKISFVTYLACHNLHSF